MTGEMDYGGNDKAAYYRRMAHGMESNFSTPSTPATAIDIQREPCKAKTKKSEPWTSTPRARLFSKQARGFCMGCLT
jgi:hypothetical protein